MRFLVLILCLLSADFVEGQKLAYSGGLEKLVNSEFAIAEITQYNPGTGNFFTLEHVQAPYMKTVTQYLVRNRNGLYLLPDGTGRIYKIELADNGVEIIRQDSTLYFGYNFGCYPFTYHDTLYSFGGYGHWQYNGHLRVYVPQKGEWELEKLNREVPFFRGVYMAPPIWYDLKKGELWIGFSVYAAEGTKEPGPAQNGITDSVYVLDLHKREWLVKGTLNPKIKKWASSFSTRSLGSSPWGQLIYDQSTFYLLDFSKNEMLALNPDVGRSITQFLGTETFTYFRDSTLFIASMKDWTSKFGRPLDSIRLSKAKFHASGNLIYAPTSKEDLSKKIESYLNTTLIIGLVVGFSLAGLVFFFFNRKKNSELQHTIPLNGEASNNLFDDKETELINLVVSYSFKGQGTPIEAINKILGVSQKNLEIQKKQRSEILISINKKWRYANSSQDLLIKKKRLEHDKRSFEYFIDFENLGRVGQFQGYVHINH